MLLLLALYVNTGIRIIEVGMYVLCVCVALPNLPSFIASLPSNGANLTLVLVFLSLLASSVVALADGRAAADLQLKALAATAVWCSIYTIVFCRLRSRRGIERLTDWVYWTTTVATASVYLSVIAHFAGVRFGEVIVFSDGGFRAFGPLGDQVAFVLVLPALVALVEGRPVLFALHVGALLLTATRGAVVCLLLGVAAYIAIVVAGRLSISRARLQRAAIAAVAGALLWLTPLSSQLLSRIDFTRNDESYSFRFTAIESGLALLAEHPLLGVGFNGFENSRRAVPEDWLNLPSAESGLQRTANQYVQTATDGGLFATVWLLLFVGLTVRNAVRCIRWNGASPALIGTMLWVIVFFAGNQGAPWLLSDATSGLMALAVAGLAARTLVLVRRGVVAAQA